MERNFSNLAGNLLYQTGQALPNFAQFAYDVHQAEKGKNSQFVKDVKKGVAYVRVAPSVMPVVNAAVNLVAYSLEKLFELLQAAWAQVQRVFAPAPVQQAVPIGAEWFTHTITRELVFVRRDQRSW